MAKPTLTLNKVLFVIIFLLLSLLVPIPQYTDIPQGCILLRYPDNCPPAKKGWVLSPPLFIQFYNWLTTPRLTQPSSSSPGAQGGSPSATPSDEINADYGCPENGWIDCMPILSEAAKKRCTPEAIARYKKNCPNFQG